MTSVLVDVGALNVCLAMRVRLLATCLVVWVRKMGMDVDVRVGVCALLFVAAQARMGRVKSINNLTKTGVLKLNTIECPLKDDLRQISINDWRLYPC